MIDIGKNIQRLRELRGLTQKELAQEIGITPAALSRLERGDEFSTNKLREIAKALGARVFDFDNSLRIDLTCLDLELTNIPKRLKQARLRVGYDTAKRASDALGIAYGTYYCHENGLRGIKGRDLTRYEGSFKVTRDWLLFGRGNIDDLGPISVNKFGAKISTREKNDAGGGSSEKPIKTIRSDKTLAQFGEEIDASAQVDSELRSAVNNPASSTLRGESGVLDFDDLSQSKINHSILENEIVAAFDGVLDGYGVSAARRNSLANAFASALAEPVQFAAGRDRAMARRAIARALVRALKIAEDS